MEHDEWLRLQAEMNMHSGQGTASSTPEPAFDPDEPWSELPPLKKVSPIAGLDLVEELRKAGIPVRGDSRSAGLFSRGKVNLKLTVPTRLQAEAVRMISGMFDSSHFDTL